MKRVSFGLLGFVAWCVVLTAFHRGDRDPVVCVDPSPYEFGRTLPSASEYWIEFNPTRGGTICHSSGRRWPIDWTESPTSYGGASAKLWIVAPRGIGHRFLVFDSPVGAYTLRRIAFRVCSDGSLLRAGDVVTSGEIQGDRDDQVMDATFEDADLDGVVEFVEVLREWVCDLRGNLIDNWGLRLTYHVWNGTCFIPRWTRIHAADKEGPLYPIIRNRDRGAAYLEAVRAIVPGQERSQEFDEDNLRFTASSEWQIENELTDDLDNDGKPETIVHARLDWGFGGCSDPRLGAIVVGRWEAGAFHVRAHTKGPPEMAFVDLRLLPRDDGHKIIVATCDMSHHYTLLETVAYDFSDLLGLVPLPDRVELLADLRSTDDETWRRAFEGLVALSGEKTMCYMPVPHERQIVELPSIGGLAVLVYAGKLCGDVCVFSRDGTLLHHKETVGVFRGRAEDLDGDGVEELFYHTAGGGTGYNAVTQHVLSLDSGAVREILSIPVKVNENVSCFASDVEHNYVAQSEVSFERAPDGVYAIVKQVISYDCSCTPEQLAGKPAPPPERILVTRYVWRKGSAEFVPDP